MCYNKKTAHSSPRPMSDPSDDLKPWLQVSSLENWSEEEVLAWVQSYPQEMFGPERSLGLIRVLDLPRQENVVYALLDDLVSKDLPHEKLREVSSQLGRCSTSFWKKTLDRLDRLPPLWNAMYRVFFVQFIPPDRSDLQKVWLSHNESQNESQPKGLIGLETMKWLTHHRTHATACAGEIWAMVQEKIAPEHALDIVDDVAKKRFLVKDMVLHASEINVLLEMVQAKPKSWWDDARKMGEAASKDVFSSIRVKACPEWFAFEEKCMLSHIVGVQKFDSMKKKM